MSVIKYSDLDKNQLKYALEGSDIRRVHEPVKRTIEDIENKFTQGRQVLQDLVQKLEDQVSYLQGKIKEIEGKLDHERYVLKTLPMTRQETYETTNAYGEKVTEKRTVPANQEIRAATVQRISSYEQTINEINGRIGALDEAIAKCRQGIYYFSEGSAKCSTANSALLDAETKFLDTCYRVSKSLSSAEKAISSYLNVSISSIQNSPVSHIRRK